eukprot:7966937-Alexandrium_andersonii.AAC.1
MDSTGVRIRWSAEDRVAFDPAWLTSICHQVRVLGGRWETLVEARLISSWELELQTVTPHAAERLARVLRNTGLKFPGGPPLPLE